jgi:hypothetical protein
VSAAPNAKATINAPARPSGSAAMNTMPLVESVTLSANDMMLPLSVMKVMPTATQPMNEVVFNRENRLTAVKKPGVVTAAATSANTATKRIATNTFPRVECGSGTRQLIRQAAGSACSLMAPRLPDE